MKMHIDIIKEAGTFIEVPADRETYPMCGTFLQSGATGEYVDMIIGRGSVSVIEEE